MTRKEQRNLIDKALKEFVNPFLRSKGFTGSFPHFRRFQNDRINLLSIYHSPHGSEFYVDIANCHPKGIITPVETVISPDKCNAVNTLRRLRFGETKKRPGRSFNYAFSTANDEKFRHLAKEVLTYWDNAENWWKRDPFKQRKSLRHNFSKYKWYDFLFKFNAS